GRRKGLDDAEVNAKFAANGAFVRHMSPPSCSRSRRPGGRSSSRSPTRPNDRSLRRRPRQLDELVGKAEADSLRQANAAEPPAPSHESQLQQEGTLGRLRDRHRYLISPDAVLRGDEHLPGRAEAINRTPEPVAPPLAHPAPPPPLHPHLTHP